MDLAPCPGCRRHVRSGGECPFCASAGPALTARVSAVGRLSRAMVFGAALAATAACGGKTKPAGTTDQRDPFPDEAHHGGGCVDPDPKRIEELEQRKASAKSEEEKTALDQELQIARQPSCMPYGAPPRRRRVV